MTYNLDRFLIAQNSPYCGYALALAEMQAGRKVSHWIWYIFPQQKGLGYSYNSECYGLDGIDEARAYLAHPILGVRLREITKVVLNQTQTKSLREIFGSNMDVLKFKTSMKLFNEVSPNDIFEMDFH